MLTLSGVILGPDGKPLANVQVCAYSVPAKKPRIGNGWCFRGKVLTDAEGKFTLDVDAHKVALTHGRRFSPGFLGGGDHRTCRLYDTSQSGMQFYIQK